MEPAHGVCHRLAVASERRPGYYRGLSQRGLQIPSSAVVARVSKAGGTPGPLPDSAAGAVSRRWRP